MKRAAWIPVATVVLLGLAACGGGGKSYPAHATVQGPLVEGSDPAAGAWLFQPAGKPKRLVIFFHGQGGPVEATPVNHRAWIDHLVAKGNAVIYPRYEQSYAEAVIGPAVAGVRTAAKQLGEPDLPVLAVGYSRGGGLAVEYAAVAALQHVPVPKAVETINTVAAGDQAQLVDLRPLRHDTILSLIVSDKDELGLVGARALLRRLRLSGFPGSQIQLHFARSTKTFLADHAGPMSTSPEAQKAYWAPTDALLKKLPS
jgi:acetyl esterase/lipase